MRLLSGYLSQHLLLAEHDDLVDDHDEIKEAEHDEPEIEASLCFYSYLSYLSYYFILMSLTEELKHRSSFPWKKIII